MKRLFLFIVLLVSNFVLMAQPILTFTTTEHDFGQIQESDGRVSTIFTFKNDGNEPLVLTNVRASCGCTTPTYTRTPIEPGDTGEIKVTYNPNGRPGRFQKSITITSNATVPTVKLYIKGEVIPKAAEGADKYPVKVDGLGLSQRVLQFGTILNDGNSTKSLEYANLTDAPMQVSIYTSSADNFLLPLMTLETIQPHQSGTFKLHFDATKCKEYGTVNRDVYIVINGKRLLDDAHRINVNAYIKENFAHLTPQERQQAPIFEVTQLVQLGTLQAGQQVNQSLTLRNAGVNTLLFRKVSCRNSSGLQARPSKESIKSGKAATLDISLNTTDLKPGSYTRQIEIITNDPNRPRVFITVTWTIE